MLAFLKKWWPHISATLIFVWNFVGPDVTDMLKAAVTAHPNWTLLTILGAIIGAVHLPTPNTVRVVKTPPILSVLLLIALAFPVTFSVYGCAAMHAGASRQTPYTSALKGSDDIAMAVHSSIVIAGKYYGLGKFSDQQKATVAGLLNSITDANMEFRRGVESAHANGATGAAEYVALAQAFLNAMPSDPAALHYYSADSQKLYHEVLDPIRLAVNGLGLMIQNAKGA